MEDSPRKQQSTSKVIDSLHSQIDSLKDELEVLRLSCGDYKKKYTILASKNDSLVDQLANCKHENDMVNALLKRKERRIADLESEFDDLNSQSESTKQTVKNYKIRCENLEASAASSTAEHERLKISYDALLASQGEYKRHYQAELSKVSAQLDAYTLESSRSLQELSSKLECNDKDVDALLEGLNGKRTLMDNLILERNKSILSLLSLLAKVAKTHGEECQSLLKDNVHIIETIRDKMPHMVENLPGHIATTIDLDSLLQESASLLTEDFAGIDAKPPCETQRQNSRTNSRRRNRNSMRISPDTSLYDAHMQQILPKQRTSTRSQSSRGSENGQCQTGGQHQSQKRNSMIVNGQNYGSANGSGGRQSSNGSQNGNSREPGNFREANNHREGNNHKDSNNHRDSGNFHPRSSSANQGIHRTVSHSGQSKNSKRRSIHGGPSTLNMDF